MNLAKKLLSKPNFIELNSRVSMSSPKFCNIICYFFLTEQQKDDANKIFFKLSHSLSILMTKRITSTLIDLISEFFITCFASF